MVNEIIIYAKVTKIAKIVTGAEHFEEISIAEAGVSINITSVIITRVMVIIIAQTITPIGLIITTIKGMAIILAPVRMLTHHNLIKINPEAITTQEAVEEADKVE